MRICLLRRELVEVLGLVLVLAAVEILVAVVDRLV
jgi:hypothetical protein